MPQLNDPNFNSFVATNGTAAANAISIGINGERPPIGHFIKFPNHNKIYQIVNRGNNTINIYPGLQQSVPHNSTLDVTPWIRVTYAPDDNITQAFNNIGWTLPTLNLIEAV